nr:heparin lyase I family protein [Bacteroidota bacterium]
SRVQDQRTAKQDAEEQEITIGTSDSNKDGRKAFNNLMYDITFEENDPCQSLHTQFPSPSSFQIVNNPLDELDKVALFELRDSDRISTATTTSARAEILFPHQNHNERWYAFSVFFPTSGYEKDSFTEIISQWHQASAGSPPQAVEVINDEIVFKTIDGDSEYNSYPLAHIERGQWHEFVFHYIHSAEQRGLIEIWYNGKKVQQFLGANIKKGYELPRFKVGIYKWKWNNGGKTDTDLRRIYYNNVKMGNEFASFEDMSSAFGRTVMAGKNGIENK